MCTTEAYKVQPAGLTTAGVATTLGGANGFLVVKTIEMGPGTGAAERVAVVGDADATDCVPITGKMDASNKNPDAPAAIVQDFLFLDFMNILLSFGLLKR